MPKRAEIRGKTAFSKKLLHELETREKIRKIKIKNGEKIKIKVLMICHGSILKSSEKASKINSSTKKKGVYYTTTAPFLKEP